MRKARLFLLVVGLVVLLAVGILGAWRLRYNVALGKKFKNVEQPIAYNHNAHVEGMGLDCTFCHQAATRSIHAGKPPLETCLGCHSTKVSDSPEAARVATYREMGYIPWKRIYKLPDHVRFSHKRHVVAGEIECTECHGDVASLTTPRTNPARLFTMTTCMECHKERGATLDCNPCHK